MSIENTLKERGNQYGMFKDHAYITQNIKNAMIDSKNWATLSADKKEALEMIAHKIGRILNGNPEYQDSWHDIIGYAKLVEDTLVRKCIYPDSYYDWIPFTPTSTSECPVSKDALVQLHLPAITDPTFLISKAGDHFWDTTPSPQFQIHAYRYAKNKDDIRPVPNTENTNRNLNSDWIPFTATKESKCPVSDDTLVQIYTESSNFSRSVVAPAKGWYWNTMPGKKYRILAYRIAKDEDDIQSFPKKTVFLDNDWVLFTATSNSKSPVPEDTLVQVLYDTNDDMNRIYKAMAIDWTNNVSIPDRVYAYRIAKHRNDTKPAPKLVNPYR